MIPKRVMKFELCHAKRGQLIQLWQVKTGDIRPISGYISQTMQDRDIATMER